MPENQTAWTTTKLKKQSTRTTILARQQTMRAGLTEPETETKNLLWTTMVATVADTPSLMQKFFGKWARAEQGICIVPSLVPPAQAVPQHSKEGCPALVNT